MTPVAGDGWQDTLRVEPKAETVTVTELTALCVLLVHVTVYGVVAVGRTSTEPEVAPLVEKFVPVQEVAPVDAQVSNELSPEIIDVGLATREAVGAVTVTGHSILVPVL